MLRYSQQSFLYLDGNNEQDVEHGEGLSWKWRQEFMQRGPEVTAVKKRRTFGPVTLARSCARDNYYFWSVCNIHARSALWFAFCARGPLPPFSLFRLSSFSLSSDPSFHFFPFFSLFFSHTLTKVLERVDLRLATWKMRALTRVNGPYRHLFCVRFCSIELKVNETNICRKGWRWERWTTANGQREWRDPPEKPHGQILPGRSLPGSLSSFSFLFALHLSSEKEPRTRETPAGAVKI